MKWHPYNFMSNYVSQHHHNKMHDTSPAVLLFGWHQAPAQPPRTYKRCLCFGCRLIRWAGLFLFIRLMPSYQTGPVRRVQPIAHTCVDGLASIRASDLRDLGPEWWCTTPHDYSIYTRLKTEIKLKKGKKMFYPHPRDSWWIHAVTSKYSHSPKRLW